MIEPMEDCWVWARWKSGDGYGDAYVNKKHQRAHRLSYEMFKGPIPKGKHIHHLCQFRSCVNPDHLMVVTPKEHNHLTAKELAAIGKVYGPERKAKCFR